MVIDVNGKDKVVLSISSIVSIAKHRFMLNGALPVSEVTIDTVGNNSLRFYYVNNQQDSPTAPPTDVRSGARQAAQQAAAEINGEVSTGKSNLPSVQYPDGVYAHTIEYQVSSSGALDTLFTSALAAWENSSDKTINIKLSNKTTNH